MDINKVDRFTVRQGDVYVTPATKVQNLPESKDKRVVLAHGEVTGHAHEIMPTLDKVVHFGAPGSPQQLRVDSEYAILDHTGSPHGDHGPVVLLGGGQVYDVTIETEYDDGVEFAVLD
jgi:hypothetical protein